jgi:hypothetical protein
VQCGEVGNVGVDTTFTAALGYGSGAASALAAVNGSLATGFADREAAYRMGWNRYVDGLRVTPASVSTDTLRRRVYYVAAMTLHAAEDKMFRGASVAGFATPWGNFTNGGNLNDGYHRVWGRHATRRAQNWTWNSSDGTLRALGKCMDVTGGGTADGTQIQLWTCNGTGAQEWRWRQQTRLVNPQSGRCLAVTGGGTSDGTRLQLWDCNDTAAGAWYLP